MAISLKNLLLLAEANGLNPDGSFFEQRSLGYGDNPPLILKDLPGVEEEPNGTTNLIGQVTDNFVRGGAIALGKSAVDDVERLGKVLISPNGIAWGVSQLALAATNPLGPILPEATGITSFLQSAIGGPRNRQSLPIGVLATAGTGAAGIRFRKDGLLDVKFESGYNYDSTNGGPKYESTLRDRINKGGDDFPDGLTLHSIYDNVNTFDVGGINIKEYSGGPHSTFGIGNTEIKKYKSNPFNDIGDNGGYLPLFNQKLFPLRQAPLTPTSKHRDYRSVEGTISEIEPIPDEKTRINLYKLGDPGIEPTGPEDEYAVYDIKTIDRISAAGIFKRQDLNMSVANSKFKDYIKFRIAVVDTENPMSDNVILFRALLDNIADNFSGEWNSFKYNGRAEKFYTYGGFDRSIDFGFKIHTQTRHEQKPLWRKLNYLVAQTAPEYKNRRMRGVFSRLTIGDWMNEIPGFFTSVNLSWSVAYPWEIRHDENGKDRDLNEYPHILDVSCNFQPVHNFAPSNSPTTPFLLPEIGVEDSQKYAQLLDGEDVLSNNNGVADSPIYADIDYRLEPLPDESNEIEENNNPTLDEVIDNNAVNQNASTGGFLSQEDLIGRFNPQNQF